MTWPLAVLSVAALIFAGFALFVVLAAAAFSAWLQQRERERLSATDKAELVKLIGELEGRLRDVKGAVSGVSRR